MNPGEAFEENILVVGARQHNLKNLDLRIPLNKLTVVTGVSGSGKSSLAFDTIYAEGQRRYVETFSTYTRQFLDRMDKPQVERIDGIPPAIAIDQINPVRTSRSTVGTMTELNDHLKMLFARSARLYCGSCGKRVQRDSPESILGALLDETDGDQSTEELPTSCLGALRRILITFSITIPQSFSAAEVQQALSLQGYQRVRRISDTAFEVIQDRTVLIQENRSRIIEDLEAALKHGHGHVAVHLLDDEGETRAVRRFSSELHCADCDEHFQDPVPNLFSFNSPLGACNECRGFGRIIDIDPGLVIPDERKSLRQGAIRPWQTESYRGCQHDLMSMAISRGVPIDVSWRELTSEQRQWVWDGQGRWEEGFWYGVKGFFKWLEKKSYRMHIRVLLSKYRSYRQCPACGGARLKSEALQWRIGGEPGRNIHEVMLMPIESCRNFFESIAYGEHERNAVLNEATAVLLREIRARLHYLVDVGLGYLTLDRQSRTLSGGEVQRINLTTALGTSLVNTLFVLDEPSIGLHPRDVDRLIHILHRLRDEGNTLLVVEHDPDVIRAADYVLDMGPGPGEKGGEIVFFGDGNELFKCQDESLTAQYLTGKKKVSSFQGPDRPVSTTQTFLEIVGAREHNLKNIDVRIPLGKLVCVTGVSGSGKSTLIHDVCYRGLCKLKALPVERAGAHLSIKGHEHIEKVVLVDQSPIGKTARSNPVSYVGAFEPIRKLFSSEPLARARGYTPGTFSFNSKKGCCPTCGGSGFEHIEMQFLSDVYLRCPDCDGKRYRSEILDVVLVPKDIRTTFDREPQSIADVLDMTVDEACSFFSYEKNSHESYSYEARILSSLAPLRDVGLGYVKLGQPVPTLSGGEAQRLKLAGHLSGSTRRNGGRILFLFDEPTTGLHFDDIGVLIAALRKLLSAGHSVVVIEHNLDVIKAADWIIDLGPEGGDAGGSIMCAGPLQEILNCDRSHTGRVLRTTAIVAGYKPHLAKAFELKSESNEIVIHRAREHNLKNVDIHIPREKFTVITGISGSGKSTVAFDLLFSEGQRRYLESLNAYARQFVQPAARPDIDGMSGIPPTVAIEQRTSRGGQKSTVATMTEIHHFLRLLIVKLGTQYCPECDVSIEPQSPEAISAGILNTHAGTRISLLAPLVVARKGYYTDLARWAANKGFTHLRVDGKLTPTDAWPRLSRYREHSIEAPINKLEVGADLENELREAVHLGLDIGGGTLLVVTSKGESVYSTSRACPRCRRSFAELDPRMFSFNSKHGWCLRCNGTGQEIGGKNEETELCRVCHGSRLRSEALHVRVFGNTIDDLSSLSITQAQDFFESIEWTGREREIGQSILSELRSRLDFLRRVGLGYLALDRSAQTLSGGEAQRIRLAAQLGSNLRGVCYILDEPTIGLHAKDNLRLLDTLAVMKSRGNTVVVVEHDETTIRRADHVIDLGPGGGPHGGAVVAEGSLEDIRKSKISITGRFLRSPLRHPLISHRPVSFGNGDRSYLEIGNAWRHNLKNLRLKVPLGRLVCITGVSGSGKSTLAREVLYANLRNLVSRGHSGDRPQDSARPQLRGCETLTGWEKISRVMEVDQSPIGKTPRSCPATYIGIWDAVRKLFAGVLEARVRGYSPSRFSFNVPGGRCEGCGGQGANRIEMSFLPDVSVICELCDGKRYNPETLSILFKERNIADVLEMSVVEAGEFFNSQPSIHHSLSILQDVGLGYLTLGQPSPTLSGGEAQRIKLVTELTKTRVEPRQQLQANARAKHSLYILDEPTIGLHMADVEKLISVLHRLVEAGNTVVIIEHNLDVIAEADWIIDLGPEGGAEGGFVVAQGSPETVAHSKNGSYTARFLEELLVRSAEKG